MKDTNGQNKLNLYNIKYINIMQKQKVGIQKHNIKQIWHELIFWF